MKGKHTSISHQSTDHQLEPIDNLRPLNGTVTPISHNHSPFDELQEGDDTDPDVIPNIYGEKMLSFKYNKSHLI